jgi:hypothetical protein
MQRTLLIFVLVVSGFSNAQVGHGTIIILDFVKDKMAIAADSRITFDNHPPDDSFCKIEVFRHRIVFTQAGSIGYVRGDLDPFPGWYNAELARRAVKEMGNPDKDPDIEIKDIASIWANSLAAYWNRAYRSNRDAVIQASKSGAGLITESVFAEARKGAVHWRFVGVGLNPTADPPIQAFTAELRDCWPCGEGERVCAMARPVVPEEFCSQSTSRAKKEAAQWKPSQDLVGKVARETLHAVRLVDDTIALDPIGGLGGKIDALELHNDGVINWVFRKQNCPDNED